MKNITVGRVSKTAKDVYRGYMPPDLPQNKPRNRIKPWWKVLGRPRVTLYPKKPIEGFSETPEYPPLDLEGGRKDCRTQIRLDWYETVKDKPTVQAKLYEINKHQNHYMAHINNWLPVYNSLPMVQYLTQTNLINKLPDNYNISTHDQEDQTNTDLVDQVKQSILEQIALDKYESLKRSPGYIAKPSSNVHSRVHVSNRFIQNLVSNTKRLMATKVNEQLLDYHYDLSPSLRSWWYHSGFKPPNNKVFYRTRKDVDGNINQMIQMDGFSSLNMRHNSFIEPVMSKTDPLITDLSLVPKIENPLTDYGSRFKFKWPVALPGFWYDDERSHLYDCPHTCFLSTDCLTDRLNQIFNLSNRLSDDEENCLTGQAILTAFGWLNSLSMYHGYTPFQEIDYPFTCQVITTDGQNWLFNIYQLNHQVFHRDLGGPKGNNICWTSGPMKLYEEYTDGQFKGVNDDVVKLLIRYFAQKTSPEYTSQLNLRPFLSQDTRTDEDIAKEKKSLYNTIVARRNLALVRDWKIPLYEHLFFRSKENRNRITHMKARWHMPKPPLSKFFD